MLKSWWDNLDDSWKKSFAFSAPTSEELHTLTHSHHVSLNGNSIKGLEPLRPFFNLRELELKQVGLIDFKGLIDHPQLTSLRCTNGPLRSLEGLEHLTHLEILDISNTAIEQLDLVAKATSLKSLYCSGTNIKKLRGLDDLQSIEQLDISNTNIFKLDRIMGYDNLKELTCFNTRLRQFEVDEFQEEHPDCTITYY